MATAGADDRMPNYINCIRNVYTSFNYYVSQQNTPVTSWPGEFYQDLIRYAEVSTREVLIVVVLAVIFTVSRWILTVTFYKPFGKWLCMTTLNQSKFPESGFKVIYYGAAWTMCVYLLFISDKYDYFYYPNHIWADWAPHSKVPSEIYWLYMVQFSFYLHSMYGTIYMDRWRKDSIVMLFHHLLTMALIGFSYAARYHKIGVLVLFMHDIADVFLEFTKCNVYMKDRGGRYYAMFDHISTVGFIGFSTSWFVFRLYWFPLKVLYSSGHGVILYAPEQMVPFYIFFNIMLWVLQGLNIYWFMFILSFLYKVLTGQMSEVDDLREEEVLEKLHKTQKENTSPHHAVNGDGDHVPNGLVKGLKKKPKKE